MRYDILFRLLLLPLTRYEYFSLTACSHTSSVCLTHSQYKLQPWKLKVLLSKVSALLSGSVQWGGTGEGGGLCGSLTHKHVAAPDIGIFKQNGLTCQHECSALSIFP
jgi:hypothetical protein